MRRNAHALTAMLLGLCPVLVAATGPVARAVAQEGGEPLPTTPFRQDDAQQQLIDLIQKVELRLIDIDRRLSDASTGSVPLEEVGDSGIDDLLRQASRDSRQTIQDIDKILEIAQQMGGQQGGGGQQSQQPQSGESPLDSERNRGPQERENTPSEPGQQPQPSGEEPQQGQEGEEPHQKDDGSPQPDDSPNGQQGENRPAGEQTQDGSGGPSGADDANRWGELPVRYREVFRNQGGEDLPVQYREWIDAYHRRLSKSRR